MYLTDTITVIKLAVSHKIPNIIDVKFVYCMLQ